MFLSIYHRMTVVDASTCSKTPVFCLAISFTLKQAFRSVLTTIATTDFDKIHH